MKKLTVILFFAFIQSNCIDAQINLNNGLSVNYPFFGNANDVSGNHLDGTTYGTKLTKDRFGNANSAYFYNGVDSYISYDNILNDVFAGVGNKFSISLWIKPFEDMTYKGIFCKDADGACSEDQQQFVLCVHNNKPMFMFMSSLGTGNSVPAEGSIDMSDTSRWYHIVTLYDGMKSTNFGLDRVKFYINNVMDYTTATFPIVGTLGNIQAGTAKLGTGNKVVPVGNDPCGPGFFFHGAIDDIRVYNRLLNTVEIDALYNGPTNVGISENNHVLNCDLFPNPASDAVNILLENASGTVDLSVFNSLGQVVYLNELRNNAGPFRYKLDLSDQPKGVYFIHLKTNKGEVSKKLVLME